MVTRIVEEVLDLELGELSFESDLATNSKNEPLRVVLLLCIRKVPMQVTSKSSLLLIIYCYLWHARMSMECVVNEAANMFQEDETRNITWVE